MLRLAVFGCVAAAVQGESPPVSVPPTAPPTAPPTEEVWVVGKEAVCDGKQTTFAKCETAAECVEACVSVDCAFAAWNSWSSSDCTGLCERQRVVAHANNECGNPCQGPMIETKRCETHCREPPVDCEFGPWSAWTGIHADGPCGDGENQKIRTREITTPSNLHGGVACTGETKETAGCDCPVPQDCELSEWSAWEECSVSCGAGQKTRTKSILQAALNGGEACEGDLQETDSCESSDDDSGACPMSVDCEWHLWSAWSACTCSCDGGQQTRNRIIKTSPKGQGELCPPEDKTEIRPCNTGPCTEELCINGEWADWGTFGTCTAACGGGVSWRSRAIAVEANACGEPSVGLDKEVVPCNPDNCAPDVDCEFRDWSAWGDCSCTENGVKRRTRAVGTYGQAAGAWCDGDLIQVAPCNTCEELDTCGTDLPPVDCLLGEWTTGLGSEGQCSATCGTGNFVQVREIISKAANGGAGCKGPLSKVKTCDAGSCPTPQPPLPCLWGDWMLWGSCDKCGGQQKRNRQIQRMPEPGGDPCEAGASEETRACPRKCHDTEHCKWSEWKEETTCSTKCGDGFITKTRFLEPEHVAAPTLEEALEPLAPLAEPLVDKLKPALGGRRLPQVNVSAAAEHVSDWNMSVAADCEGRQMQRFACNLGACVTECLPQDAMFSEWGNWSAGDCTGLCERKRGIAQHNNECGTPAKGSLIETKRCHPDCHKPPVDCAWAQWSDWMTQEEIAGETCVGDDEYQKVRVRLIEVNATRGGQPCEGDMKEIEKCEAKPAVSCVLSEWTAWDTCSATCGAGQEMRTRTIVTEATSHGQYCEGDLTNTRPCKMDDCGDDQDCVWAEWAEWSACTCSCGGGQKSRDRVIKESPKGTGQLCDPHSRSEILQCKTQPCDSEVCVDGKWGEWGAFGECSAECGGGLQTRYRRVVTEANSCGSPAVGPDRDVVPCQEQACGGDVDCVLGDWSAWGDCSCMDNGIRHRVRQVDTYGAGDGAWCNGDLNQVEPCNTCEQLGTCKAEEDPIDCVLSAWAAADGAAGTCSVTCGAGNLEMIKVVTIEALHGGAQCNGAMKKVMPCTMDGCPSPPPPRACQWGEWMQWGACDKCGGQRKRTRQIVAMPEAGGEPCEMGASEEVDDCPRQCHTTYWCEWGDWEDEGDCTVTCGTGIIKKARYLQATAIPVESLAQVYDDLQQEDAAEDNYSKDVVVAFGSGGLVSLTLFLVINRAMRSAPHSYTMMDRGGQPLTAD